MELRKASAARCRTKFGRLDPTNAHARLEEGTELIIAVPDAATALLLEEDYRDSIKQCVAEVIGPEITELRYVLLGHRIT